MEVIAVRSCMIGGVNYKAGDSVVGLSPDKESQLIGQRWLKEKHKKNLEYTVLRPFTVGGVAYVRGQKVRITKLSDQKLAQFLENRILEPVAPA